MESKTIGIIAIILFTLFGLFIWGYSNNGWNVAAVGAAPAASSTTKGALTTQEALYDFGTISMKNGDVTKDFTVTNPTDEDILVSTVLTSCMCTSAFIVEPDGGLKGPFKMPGMGYVPRANELIKAGESRVIRVVYDPNAHGPAGVGKIDRFITLTDRSGGTLELEVQALVMP